MKANLTTKTTMTLQTGYEMFYLFFDEAIYWGLNFADSVVASIFLDRFNSSMTTLKESDGKTVVTATTTKKVSVPASNHDHDTSKLASRSVSAINKKSEMSPVNIRSIQSFNTPSTSTVGAGSAPNSAGRTTPKATVSVAKQTAVASSLPSSPAGLVTTSYAATDDSLKSSPSAKALARPDGRKRSATSLHASDDTKLTSSSKPKGEKTQREKIIDEVLKTEEDYVDSLTLIREKYILPLKYAPRLGVTIFKPGDLEKMMYGLEPIYVLNTQLLTELKQEKRHGTLYNNCGAILQSYAPTMKLYIDYVNKYDNTIKMIKDYEDTNPIFKTFLEITVADPEASGRGIRDFWIMPIQRVPRYVLLLTELTKHTPDDHSDKVYIKQALASIQEIATYINNRKKDYDSQEKVALLQQRLNPKSAPIMRERRTFVAEGIVYMKNPLFIPPKKPIKVKKDKPPPVPDQIGLLEVELFLFNDLILWATKDLKHIYLNELGRVNLSDLLVCEERPHWTVPFYEETSMYKGLSFRTQDQTDENAPLFYCSDVATADKWISNIVDKFKAAASARAAELERIAKASKSPS